MKSSLPMKEETAKGVLNQTMFFFDIVLHLTVIK